MRKTSDISLLDRRIATPALKAALTKLDPRSMARNPVMFVTEVVAALSTLLFLRDLVLGGENVVLVGQISAWLWFTVYFASFAEAMAEGRGRARADSLRATQSDTPARKLATVDTQAHEVVSSRSLKSGDLVLVQVGDIVPADGEIVAGIASVDESAITGESAPVIREAGGDRSAVTGGTRVVSDWVKVRITSKPGESFLDRMIAMVEGAERQKTPNEIALNILLVGMTIIFLIVIVTLQPFMIYSGAFVPVVFLIALLVTLIPTTIGGLLSAIGIAGMDRLVRSNVIAKSGRAVEAAGDVEVLLLDKTGTITIGARMADALAALPGVSQRELVETALLASLADETPEGRSIVDFARKQTSTGAERPDLVAETIPFSANTRLSGANLKDGSRIRKGAADAILAWCGIGASPELRALVEGIAKSGGTPLLVGKDKRVLGVVHLKDIVKPGIRERFAQLRRMGVRTVMVTGDNPLEAPVSQALVRTAKRMAERSRTDWIAANVVTSQSERLPDAAKDAIAETLRLAELLGAEIATINAERDVAEEILSFARSRNVLRIVIGRPRPRRLTAWLFRETVAEEIIFKADDFEVTVLSADPAEARKAIIGAPRPAPERDPFAYLWATAAVVASGTAALAVNHIFPIESLSLFFLIGVLGIASRFGLWRSIYASVLAFLGYNFFFTEPYYTFSVARRNDLLALFLFLLVAIVTGNLAARLRSQARAQQAVAKRTANLFDFSRKVASVASLDDVLWAVVSHVVSTMKCSSLVLIPDENGKLAIVSGLPPEDQLDARDWGAAKWAWDKQEPAGWSSQTLPSATWLFLPMKSANRVHGLLGVQFGARLYITAEERRLLDSLVDQVGIAIERTKLAADMEQTRLLAETESLRAALLSSVSHDLRTPLVSIIGPATSLVASDRDLGESGRRAMAETIRDEGERLNRYVQNLLDMTRLGYGALKVAREPVDLREVAGRALLRMQRDLAAQRVVRHLPASLPDVVADPVLLDQVVTNILDNAAKYAPAGSDVTIVAAETEDSVVLTISDEGPGIPEAERARVFDMVFRVRSGDARPGGTGLGLAIAKGIVEAHGGSIRAEPARADGSGTRIAIALSKNAAQRGDAA